MIGKSGVLPAARRVPRPCGPCGSDLRPLTYDKSHALAVFAGFRSWRQGSRLFVSGPAPREAFQAAALSAIFCRSLGIGGLAWNAPGVDYSIAQMLSDGGPTVASVVETKILKNKRVSVRARAKLSCATERLAKQCLEHCDSNQTEAIM